MLPKRNKKSMKNAQINFFIDFITINHNEGLIAIFWIGQGAGH